jgi:hypothetical protein
MKALSLLLFLKEKRTRKVKRRACINGVPQQAHIAKEDAALPTVSTESVFICRKPPRYVPYKCTYVPYDGTFGTSDQGQTLDV